MRQPPLEYLDYFERPSILEGELSVDPFYFVLWRPEELSGMNQEYEVEKYAPAYLGFATSGGGEMLAFDSQNKIFTLPFIGMSEDSALPVAETWAEFVTLMKP